MKSYISNQTNINIVITLMLSITAFVLIFTSHQLIAAINPNKLNGMETGVELDKHTFDISKTHTKPLLITGLFSNCKSTCPANVSLLRKVKSTSNDELNYLFINLQPNENSYELLSDYLSEFAPDIQLLLPKDDQELARLMNMLPENFSLTKTNIHHSGYIYLSHPKSKGLIVYSKPDSQQIIDDLSTLQRRGN